MNLHTLLHVRHVVAFRQERRNTRREVRRRDCAFSTRAGLPRTPTPPPFRSTPAVSLHQINVRGMDGRRMRNSFPLSSPS